MKTAIVIPARYNSSRFPGKPLAPIKGISTLERTWRIAKAASPDNVYIATDDVRIEDHARTFGGEVIQTRSECSNGTERVYDALTKVSETPDVVLNLQGDAVLTPPWILTELMEAMRRDSSVRLATPATKISLEQYQILAEQKAKGIVGGTTVVFDKNHNALYFSKAMIPFVRSPKALQELPLHRHIGLYGYRFETLKEYLSLPPSPLEILEGLEQLRALENGIGIKIVEVDYRGRTHWSVDSPDDVPRCEAIIEEQGELFELPTGKIQGK